MGFYVILFLSYYKLHFIFQSLFPFFFLFCSHLTSIHIPYNTHSLCYIVIMNLWNEILIHNRKYVDISVWKENEIIADNVFGFLFSFLCVLCMCTYQHYTAGLLLSWKRSRGFLLKQCHFVDLFFFLLCFRPRGREFFITSIFMCSRLQYGLFVFDGILYVI